MAKIPCVKHTEGCIVDDAQNVCPSGWHLPDSTEAKTLLSTAASLTGKGNAYALMSTSGWQTSTNDDQSITAGISVAGGNLLDFTVLPAGEKTGNVYDLLGSHAYFWTSNNGVTKNTEVENTANGTFFWFNSNEIYLNEEKGKTAIRRDSPKTRSYSVRCLKD